MTDLHHPDHDVGRQCCCCNCCCLELDSPVIVGVVAEEASVVVWPVSVPLLLLKSAETGDVAVAAVAAAPQRMQSIRE